MPAAPAGAGARRPVRQEARPCSVSSSAIAPPDPDGEWIELPSRGPKWEASAGERDGRLSSGGAPAPLEVIETYKTDGRVLDWTIDLEATGPSAVEVGDLGISVPVGRAVGRESRPDLRARLPAAPVRLRPRLVLLFRARLGRAAVPAGHGPPGNEARVLGRRRPRRRPRSSSTRPRRAAPRRAAPGARPTRRSSSRPPAAPGARPPTASGCSGPEATRSSATCSIGKGCSTSASCRA